jgi:ABC-type transport system involved in multi-copper enzyme maturation permease subunit
MTAVISAAPGRVTQARVLNSEWIKLRTLRSTFWSLFAAVAMMIALSVIFSWVFSSQWATMPVERKAEFDPVAVPLRGWFFAQLAVGVLGVMVVTGEYSTGMIKASLAAVPRRLPVLWAKAVVFSAVVFVLCTTTSFVCFYIGQGFFSAKDIGTTISSPGALRIVVGVGLYLTFVGLLAVAFGTILRSTAGAIAAVFGVLLVLPVVGEALNLTSWGEKVTPYLPSNAGQALLQLKPDPNGLAPWTGFGIFVLYTAVAMAAAAYLLTRRDA